MADGLVTSINGAPIPGTGAINAAAFADDPKGTLGYLRYAYQDGGLVWEYDTGAAPSAWKLNSDTITFGDSGEGDTDTSLGLTGAQTNADTSLLKNGFFSSIAYTTVKGIALRPSSAIYDPTTAAATGAKSADRVGNLRNDCLGIAGEFTKAALEGAYVEFYQQSRKCFALYGKAEQMPQGFGFASQEDVTNGPTGCGQMAQSRRPVIIPPGNSNTPEYVWRLTFGRKLSVPADPSFAAPADAQIAVQKITAFFDIYFSDANGIPLVMDGSRADIYELLIANDYKVSY